MSKLLRRIAIPGAAAAMIASGGFAFMASNGVPTTHAGDGENTISGFNVSNVHYTYKNNDDTHFVAIIDSVSFTLSADASSATALLSPRDTDSTRFYTYPCTLTNAATNQWKCTPSGSSEPVADASGLRVVAVQ